MKNRPRLSDVAKLANVTTATVSAVVNAQGNHNIRVGPETRERVLRAIEQLGYVANAAARTLAKGKNQLIGIFTYESIFPFKQHDFYYQFLLGIEEEAEAQKYNLLLFTNVTAPDGKRSIYHEGVSQLSMADGSILLGLNEDKAELIRLHHEGHHFVYIGRRDVPGITLSYTAADYAAATCQLTELMFDLGHRQLVYACLPHLIESNLDRENGFMSAYQKSGYDLPAEPVMRINPEQVKLETLQALLAKGITGAVVENDSLANALLTCLTDLGLSVPSDFSITLCGDPQHTWDNAPDWTMFSIPRREMGLHAVRLLVKQLQADGHYEPESIYLPCTLIIGQTTAPPPVSAKK